MVETQGNPLPTVNEPASDGAEAVDKVLDGAESAAEIAAETAVPQLNIVIVKQLFQGICDWITSQFKSFFGKETGFVVIDIEQYANLLSAASALASLIAAQKSGDQNAIDQANQNANSAVAPILHYVGSVQPPST